MFKYAAIGLVLGSATVFLSVVIVNALLGGVVTSAVTETATLNLGVVVGIVVLYMLLAVGVGEILDSAHRETKHKK